jgi:hypothetical protein
MNADIICGSQFWWRLTGAGKIEYIFMQTIRKHGMILVPVDNDNEQKTSISA